MNPVDQGPAQLRASDGEFVDGLLYLVCYGGRVLAQGEEPVVDGLQEQDLPPHFLSITITYFLRIAQRVRYRNRSDRSPGALTAPAVTLGHETIAARATDILVWRALQGTSSLLLPATDAG